MNLTFFSKRLKNKEWTHKLMNMYDFNYEDFSICFIGVYI